MTNVDMQERQEGKTYKEELGATSIGL